MTIDLDTLISAAHEREAARQAERERKAIEDWNRRVADWREAYRRKACEAFGADFMQSLAPKLKVGRERSYEIRGVVAYRGKAFELTYRDQWQWMRVDDDTAPERGVGPAVALKDLYLVSGEERQDRLLCALLDLADAPPLVSEDDRASATQEETEEDNYQYLKSGLVTHLTRAGIIDGSESYDAWPDGLLNAVYRLREQRDALYSAGEMYYNLLRGQSPTCDEAMEKALAAVHYPDTIS